MQLRSGDVLAAINTIETRISKMIESVKEFGAQLSSSLVGASTAATSMASAFSDISKIDPPIDRSTELMYGNIVESAKMLNKHMSSTLESKAAEIGISRQILETSIAELAKRKLITDEAGKLQTNYQIIEQLRKGELQFNHLALADQQKLVAGLQTITMEYQKQILRGKEIKMLMDKHGKLMSTAKHMRIIMQKMDKEQITDLKTIEKRLKASILANEDLQKVYGMSRKEVEDTLHLIKQMTKESISFADIINKKIIPGLQHGAAYSERFLPGAGQFAQLLTPSLMWQDSMGRINKLYEDNHTVANLMIGSSKETVNITKTLGAVMMDAAGDGVLLDESQAALTATLHASNRAVVQNTAELTAMVHNTASVARATGVAVDQIADLKNAIKGQTGEMRDAVQFGDVLTNSMTNFGTTTGEATEIVAFQRKNVVALAHSYNAIKAPSGRMISAQSQITVGFSMAAAAARKIGLDGKAAMDVLAGAMTKPLDNILLLRGALNSKDPTERMLATSKNAMQIAEKMKAASPVQRQVLEEMYNITMDQAAATGALYQSTLDDLHIQAKDADSKENQIKIMTAMKVAMDKQNDSKKADADRTAAAANATRDITLAFQKFAIMVGNLADKFQPLLDIFAKIVGNPIGMWVVGSIAAFLVLVSVLSKVINAFKMMGINLIKVGNAIPDGKTTGGLGKAISGIMDGLKNLNPASMGKAAIASAMLAIVAAGIAASISMIGLAMSYFPPGHVAEFIALTTGLIIATKAIGMVGRVGPAALWGAVLLLAIGAALAGAIALIGLAMKLMPDDTGKVADDLLSLAMALMTMAGPMIPGLIGAGLLAAAMLVLSPAMLAWSLLGSLGGLDKASSSLATMGSVISSIGMDAGLVLISLAAGIIAFSAAMAGGALVSFFSGDMVAHATEMAAAMAQLVGPIAQLGGLGSTVGNSFTMIADGLNKFTEVLDKGGGLFGTNFVKRADELSTALTKMVSPIAQLNQAQQGQAAAQARDLAKVQAEEIKSALAVSIDQGKAKDSEIVKELREIKDSISKMMENSKDQIADDVKKAVKHLGSLVTEVMMGSSLGGSSANNDYAAGSR